MSASRVCIAALLKQAITLQGVSDTPRLDAEVLLCHVLNKPRSYLYTWPERELEPDLQRAFEQLLQRRQRGEPIAHLLGTKEFWSLSLQVDDSTLIPRPETELLVEAGLELIDKASARILDLGTGTGAIALALASERPAWQIMAVDVVPEAVVLAEGNRRCLGFENVTVAESDWFSNLHRQKFDLIVANPPYIDRADPHLHRGDVLFEPSSALVSRNNGLADLEAIVADAGWYLSEAGWLLLEHGYQQAVEVSRLLSEAGFISVKSRRDLQGHERLCYGRWPG